MLDIGKLESRPYFPQLSLKLYESKMFEKLKSIFVKSAKAPNRSKIPQNGEPIEAYFQTALNNSPYFKKESHGVLLNHLTHRTSIHRTDNLLTNEEKRKLDINPRLKITREFLEVLTEEGLNRSNPKQALSNLYIDCTRQKLEDDNYQRAIEAGIKNFTLLHSDDEHVCEWCSQNSSQQFGCDVLDILRKNCSCRRTLIQPIIDS